MKKPSRKTWAALKLAEDPDYFKKLGRKGGNADRDKSTYYYSKLAKEDPDAHKEISRIGGKKSPSK